MTMNLKKFLSVIMAIITLIAIIRFENFADVTLDLVASSQIANKGETATITVSVKNNTHGFCSIRTEVLFPTELTCTSAKLNNSALNTFDWDGENTTQKGTRIASEGGKVTLYYVSYSENIQGDVLFATLTFKVSDDATLGDKDITLSFNPKDIFYYSAGTYEEENLVKTVLSSAATNGKITVVDCLHANTTVHPAVASTCSVAGHAAYTTCDDCGKVVEGSDEALPVNPKNHGETEVRDAKDADCTTAGYTGDTYCKDCGNKIATGTTILALGHNYIDLIDDKYYRFAADCTHGNIYYKSCSRCGEKSSETFESKIYMPCGENSGFIIKGNTLYIHGTGDTDNYKTQASVPWYDYADSITEIIIDEDITKIGNYAFYCLSNLESIESKNNNLNFGKYAINSTNTDVTVFAENGGNIENYCTENSINYIDTTITPEVESVTANNITVKAVEGYEYSLNSTNWQSSNIFAGLSPATEYNIYARYTATADVFDTVGTPLIIKTDKATVLAPDAPNYQSHTDNSIALEHNDLYEYSMDGENWQESSEFTGLSKNTVYRFYQRIAETQTEYVSPSSAPLITAIPDKPKILEAGYENILLKKIRGFEYCLDDFVWQDSNSFDMLIDNTEYYVYQRLKAVDEEKVHQITSDYTAVITDNNIVHTHTVIKWITAKEPTCTEKGTESGVCTDCGQTITRDTNVLGHDYIPVITPPTCTEQGYTTHTCSRCGDSYADDYTDMLGHTDGEWESDENGHWHTCTVCNQKHDEAEHTESDFIIDKSPSIYESGLKHKECTVCGKVLETEIIPDTHTPGDIDGDGEMTNQDLIALFQYLSGWDVPVNSAALDIDGDDEITNQDLILLFQKLSGWDVEIQ